MVFIYSGDHEIPYRRRNILIFCENANTYKKVRNILQGVYKIQFSGEYVEGSWPYIKIRFGGSGRIHSASPFHSNYGVDGLIVIPCSTALRGVKFDENDMPLLNQNWVVYG